MMSIPVSPIRMALFEDTEGNRLALQGDQQSGKSKP